MTARRRAFGLLLVVLGGAGLVAVVLAWSTYGLTGLASPLWAALLPALVLVAGLHLLRGPTPEAPEKAPEPVTIGRIPDGPVSACMRCGSTEMQPAPLGADALFAQWRCARCHWRGQPLKFDDRESYEAFVRALHGAGEN